VLESYVGRLENVEANDQNTLLRITNTMLKRISKAQDIEFRGRLYIALSKMLKLCHESGLKNKSAAGSNVLLDD
jgi:THO complex subunit 1